FRGSGVENTQLLLVTSSVFRGSGAENTQLLLVTRNAPPIPRQKISSQFRPLLLCRFLAAISLLCRRVRTESASSLIHSRC
ncbi:hypothetical protein LINPERHAP1_LOCUS33024, partial [Linum perenne]